MRRTPATYDRILKHIEGHQITVHCTVTRQQVQPRRLSRGVRAASGRRNPDVSQIWVSLYTPQVGEVSDERLLPADRERVVAALMHAATVVPEAARCPKGLIKVYANAAARARTSASSRRRRRCVSADFERQITPCQFGGTPDCAQLRLHRVGRARRGRAPPAARRAPRRRDLRDVAARSARPCAPGASRVRSASQARLPDILQSLMRTFRKASRTRAVRPRVRARARRHRSSAARPDHPDPPLQHRLRLLQRVRQGVASRSRPTRCCARIDKLADLGTSVVAFSGGEPMLHPDLDDLIRRIRSPRHDGRPHHQRLLARRRSGSRS